MRKWVFVFCCLMITYGFGQIQQPRNDSFNELVFFIGSNNSIYDNAEGSRYLNEEFVLAKINELEKARLVRFNVSENKVEIKDKDDKIMSLSQLHDYTIRLLNGSNKVYETMPYIDEEGNSKQSFFEKMHENEKFKLCLKERIKFFPKKLSKSSYEQEVPAKFVKVNDKFYTTGLKTDSQVLVEIPKRKRDFLKLFGDSAKDVDDFIKREKLKVEMKNDIIKILDFYFAKK